MKLSAATFLTLFASSAAARELSPAAAAKVLRNARRLDQNNNGQDEDENAFLTKYNLKFIGCNQNQQMMDQDGGYSYGAAFLRLCPSDNGCDGSFAGCKEGYGDFAVSIEDYVDAFFEDQADNMQWDDQFDGNKFAKCEQYEPEVDGDDDPWANYQFFTGAACTDDGEDIKIAFFEDETCTTESSVAFTDVSNGWELPYSDGGLISTQCFDCLEYDEDAGGYDLRDMCVELYQNSNMKCETNMEYTSYYGKSEGGCETIEELLPRAARVGGGAGKVFGWIVFILLIVGVAGYVMWWRKKKQASGAADGMLA